jgi:3-isopropylmalate/(R)-2-methylmalate dehydratase large subunit
MRAVANILKDRKTAPAVILKIVPATDEIWKECLYEGLLGIFKESGALVSNAGCAGCASGQVGQNGPGEVTVSTGNRNFSGKQGKGDVYLTSPEVAAASAIAGYITIPEYISSETPEVISNRVKVPVRDKTPLSTENKPLVLEGKIWLIPEDHIDTDMIFHNRHLAITDLSEMGRHTFGNLKGWENFSSQVQAGDIVVTGRNFGAGSSRQQAVDCFRALQIQAIVAQSFGAIYERNAINAGFPVLTYHSLDELELCQHDPIIINLEKSTLRNLRNNKEIQLNEFSEVQMRIYKAGDLLRTVE